MWHKDRAQPSQSRARRSRFGIFFKTVSYTCQGGGQWSRSVKAEKVGRPTTCMVGRQSKCSKPPQACDGDPAHLL
jgi:hypothetical protein